MFVTIRIQSFALYGSQHMRLSLVLHCLSSFTKLLTIKYATPPSSFSAASLRLYSFLSYQTFQRAQVFIIRGNILRFHFSN